MTDHIRRRGLNQRVVDLHAEYPDWTAGQIAAWLEASSAYVIATAKRRGIVLPKRTSATIKPHEAPTHVTSAAGTHKPGSGL